jgi:hypothetical protein
MSADIHAKLGDKAGQKKALKALIAAYEALDDAVKSQQRTKEQVARARADLTKLGG